MPKLHLFFPENDLALALNQAHYTPPPAAARLRQAGELLPFFFGNDGDKVLCQGVNAQWLNKIKQTFGLETDVFHANPNDFAPAPWGWSKAARTAFLNIGMSADNLPTDNQLERIRQLSHRRTSAQIAEGLASVLDFPIAPPAVEVSDIEQVRSCVDKYGSAVLKLPWSSSGRGVILVNINDFAQLKPQIENSLKRYGSLMCETRMDKLTDFAMLFNIEGGKCEYKGLSFFKTTGFAAYSGNILAPQSVLEAETQVPVAHLDALKSAIPPILENIIGEDYSGPLGVDMMAVANADYAVAPAVELNLRNTMGHVSLYIYQRFVKQGAMGRFEVSTNGAGSMDADIRNTRIVAGLVSLSQPGAPFSFNVIID